tara:strand:+ start:357 stop:1517 length:1161 start_codon:yes stop_codon:yes gene_type:complete
MPTTYEPLDVNTDTTTTKTILHEVIPLTGTIVSGTYDSPDGTSFNIKNYTHGMFQSVYDYPFLSSSANHIFDLTVSLHSASFLTSSGTAFVAGTDSTQKTKKINTYTQFAQVLLGFEDSNLNTVEVFESDTIISDNDNQMKEVFVIPFSRLVTKDQIKKGSFSITLGTGSHASPFANNDCDARLKIQDLSASTDGGTSTHLGGEYGVLYVSSGSNPFVTNLLNGKTHGPAGAEDNHLAVGAVFYQAGIAVITGSVFDDVSASFILAADGAGNQTYSQAMTGSSISASCDAIRHRIADISFNNSTEINSTIYFCRLPVNKFNYSTNPTYTSASQIQVKNTADDLPVAYVSTVGLYNTRNELLAVAKLSEPLKKTPQNELTIRVRLDY